MCLSVFYAFVIGWYLILVNLGMLAHQSHFKKIRTDLSADHPLITIISCLGILFGLVVVVTHNLWIAAWPVLVTLVGWFFLLRGAGAMLFPDQASKFWKTFYGKTGHNSVAFVWLLIGLYLVWMGFENINTDMMMSR